MKKILLLMPIVFLCWSVDLFSQTKWTKIINASGNTEEYSYSISVDSNDNVYSTGGREINGRPKVYTIKLNSMGLFKWEKLYSFSNSSWLGYSIFARNNNSVLISAYGGDSTNILDLNNQGVLQSRFTYAISKDDVIQVYNMRKTTNNKFILCGRINYTFGYMALLDSNMNVIWQKSIVPSTGKFKEFQSGIFFNGNYYLCGSTFSSSSNEIPYITKIDLDGNIIWDKQCLVYNTYPNFSNAIRINSLNNRLIISGITKDSVQNNYYRTYFMFLNENGDKVKRFIVDANNSERVNDVQYYNNKIYYISSVLHQMSSVMESSLSILDTNFNLLNNKIININYHTELVSMFFSGKHLYLSGNTYKNTGSNTSTDILIIKTDSTLEIPPVGIKDEYIVINNFTLHQNYPNPFNPSTKISYSLKKSSAIELKLFDINGRLIKIIESGFKSTGSYDIIFSAEGLSSGVYFFSLYSEGILMDTKKAVVLK